MVVFGGEDGAQGLPSSPRDVGNAGRQGWLLRPEWQTAFKLASWQAGMLVSWKIPKAINIFLKLVDQAISLDNF